MRIISPSEGFLIHVKHSLLLPDKAFNNDCLRLWDPILGNMRIRERFGQDYYEDDLDYYDYFDGTKLYYTPLFFGHNYSFIPSPLFVDFLKQHFKSREELIKYPFRSNEFPTYYSDGQKLDILPDFINKQEIVEKFAEMIHKGKKLSEKRIRGKIQKFESVAYINVFSNMFSKFPLCSVDLDKSWDSFEEQEKDSEFLSWRMTPVNITVFECWESYILWELLGKTKDFSVSRCVNCGSFLDIKAGQHKDRKYCTKVENPDCYKAQNRLKKARQRRIC